MGCYNSRAADDYADRLGKEELEQEAKVKFCDDYISDYLTKAKYLGDLIQTEELEGKLMELILDLLNNRQPKVTFEEIVEGIYNDLVKEAEEKW